MAGPGRPKAEIPTTAVSFKLQVPEADMLRDACARLGVSPGRLIGRMIRASFEPTITPEVVERTLLDAVDDGHPRG